MSMDTDDVQKESGFDRSVSLDLGSALELPTLLQWEQKNARTVCRTRE